MLVTKKPSKETIVKSLFENENDKKIICIKTKSFNKQQHVAPLNQAYKFDLFSTTCVCRLVEPLSFFS